ncbi:RadC family protein [Desulfurobacterium atlanticum]|uniref:DNA replication and repair protein RadC n=1 Tax=Desulfurobacterium atlanticum TaxID=240169 RepID=A0A238YR27_9BACT|nr:DNA repair protein RadC [Desulfurobacterium atlanticum]SNR73432.1 DNA replication and repair protein RadC [Desulfurobacterium atlanticum]
MSFYTIKELPESDRPREKLLKLGAENLTDTELIAILLRTGTKGKNVLDLARELLKHFSGINGLSEASIAELSKFKGLGKTKAITLKAAIETGKRAGIVARKPKISSPEQAYNILRNFSFNKVEIFGIITLNTKGEVINIHQITKGGLNFTHITPKEVFHPAVKDLSNTIILFHNHPSGSPEPSSEDIKITHELIKAGNLLDIEIVDHIILGNNIFFSMKKEGLI